MRRSRLGSLNATTNASIAAPAPKIRATTVSRTKPMMRESMVMLLRRAKTPKRFICCHPCRVGQSAQVYPKSPFQAACGAGAVFGAA